ncbi:hypothetical protein N7486_005102 [Penicillium sp. IBT 16267x]|nr:hypothetical protein N7486_005102 [Penicillium sp. IBT 16267x]
MSRKIENRKSNTEFYIRFKVVANVYSLAAEIYYPSPLQRRHQVIGYDIDPRTSPWDLATVGVNTKPPLAYNSTLRYAQPQ